MTMKVRLDLDAWDAGFAAGEAGEPAACPYPVRSAEALSWRSGFIEGRAQRDDTGEEHLNRLSESICPGGLR
jgi:hypothetical protein